MTDIVVLGLDGATWNVLNPLIDEGHLPNLKRIRNGGHHGTLESTFPPITAPAWLSMATGQNPGKTGVFYFLNRANTDSFQFETMGVDDFRGRSFWDVFNSHDVSTGVFNFPMLYPTYDSKGFMVSGFGAPEDEIITSPISLQNELEQLTGGYEVKIPYAEPKYANRPNKLKQDLYRLLEKREQAIEYLLHEKRPDVFFGVISVTDWAQHYFWRYYDPDHVLYQPSEHEDALSNLFARVDETVGKVASFAAEENATLFIVSDHGFGAVNGTFFSNDWLEQEFYQTPATQTLLGKLQTQYFPYLRRFLEPAVSLLPVLSDLAAEIGRSVRASPFEGIDQDRSIAFASEQGFTTGLIYMLSDDIADRAAVVESLEELCTAHGLDIEVYAPEDLYEGPKIDLAPDILFEIEGLKYAVDPRHSTHDDIFSENPPSDARSGGHRREGIYIVSGPNVTSGTGEEHSILDIAPTLLALQSIPIPNIMDGEPFSEAFMNELNTQRAPLKCLVTRRTSTDKRQDPEEVRSRLEDLGYL